MTTATRIRSLRLATSAILVGGFLVAGCGSGEAAAPLPKLKLDASRTTVSGLSSGAYMATQVHMAFSDHIAGVAMIGGGPYGCAQGSIESALSRCLYPSPDDLPDVDTLVDVARQKASKGAISPISGLLGDRVFVMHGTLDTRVSDAVSQAGAGFYRKLGGAAVEEDMTRKMGHAFPTLGSGVDCKKSESPFIGKCGFDGAGDVLDKLYPEHVDAAATATGELRSFDQKAYFPDGKDALIADTGYLYIPKSCAAGESCSLHIALHGCQQNSDLVGESFIKDAGYNRWADARHLVVLYPQTRASYAPLNPKACWDWWGYSGSDYDTRQGVQLRWLARVAAALGAPLE